MERYLLRLKRPSTDSHLGMVIDDQVLFDCGGDLGFFVEDQYPGWDFVSGETASPVEIRHYFGSQP